MYVSTQKSSAELTHTVTMILPAFTLVRLRLYVKLPPLSKILQVVLVCCNEVNNTTTYLLVEAYPRKRTSVTAGNSIVTV